MRRWASLVLGVVLMMITTVPGNAQITKLFPVPRELLLGSSDSEKPTENTLSNEPLSEKVVYPLPPGITPIGISEPTVSTITSETVKDDLSAMESSHSKEPIVSIDLKISSSTESPVKDMVPSITESPTMESTPYVITEPTHLQKTIPADVSSHTEATPNAETKTTLIQETNPPSTTAPSVEETTFFSTADTESMANNKPCITPIGKNGECKSIHHCPSLIKLIKRQPLLVENKLYLQRSQCGLENNTVLACCPDNVPEPTLSPKWSLLPKPGKCGKMTENRLYGGYMTEIDSYNWLALLEYSKGANNSGFHCGGALINDRYILTAAHCVSDLPATWSLKSVRLGEWDISTTMDCSKYDNLKDCADPHVDIQIEEMIPHKDFVSTSKNKLHDIALIRLSNQIKTSDFIQPICLPHGENNLHGFDDQSLDVVGWGASPDGLWDNIKQRASAPVIHLNNCRIKYAENNITLESSQFCILGRIVNDTCRIDSGGPLISFDTSNRGLGSYYIAGIQSFGPQPCWVEGLPGVYTRVAEYLDWILDNIHA